MVASWLRHSTCEESRVRVTEWKICYEIAAQLQVIKLHMVRPVLAGNKQNA